MQVLLEADRVHDVPAVEAEPSADLVEAVGADDLGQARVGRRELVVLARAVRRLGVEVVGAAEVVLGARAADGRELRVAVHEELDLALAPPAVVVDAPGHVGADVVAPALDAVEDGVDVLVRQRVDAAELGVEVGGVVRHVGQRVVDLVVEHVMSSFVADVLHGDLAALAEGHLPVAVEGAARVDADRQRGDLGVLAPAAGEEVADRAFDRGLRLAVPVDAQDGEAPGAGGRHPDLLDGARALDVGHGEGLPGRDADGGRDLPALAQVAGRGLAGPSVAMPPCPSRR